jgi:hypothetical protein
METVENIFDQHRTFDFIGDIPKLREQEETRRQQPAETFGSRAPVSFKPWATGLRIQSSRTYDKAS